MSAQHLNGEEMDNFDRFLLTVVYDIPHLVFVVDPVDKRIIYANQRMLDLAGTDCIGSLFAEKFSSAGGDHFFVSYMHSRSALATDIALANTAEGFPQQSEYYSDDSEDWFHVLQRPIKWLDGTRKIVFILNEINALKRLQKELSEAHATLAFKNHELEIAAKTDRLTQLYNRHHLDEVLHREITRFKRTGTPFTVFIADCDKFKSVNDSYGHQVGDMVLMDIARLMRANVRATDTVGRWGGEEFLVILPDTNLDGAVQLAEKMRLTIAGHDFPTVGHKTASFGVAEMRPNENIKELIGRADEALYRAKEGGRNCIEADA
ncbi:MAG: GGDEF domain-containing protein [Burkholderiales bacterium]|nr:GGDEF domain-containing protein [Burkholderiales bacterium]MBK9345775.1 GGDEF domain-containing protein [Burkholderiales bacterium]